MDWVVGLLIGLLCMAVLLIIVLIVVQGGINDRLRRAQLDLGTAKSARITYQERITAAEQARDSARARVADLEARLGQVADDQSYQQYLERIHAPLAEYKSLNDKNAALVRWRAEVDAEERKLAERGEILRGFGSLAEAREALTKEQQATADRLSQEQSRGEAAVLAAKEAFDEELKAQRRVRDANLRRLGDEMKSEEDKMGSRREALDKANQQLDARKAEIERMGAGLDSRVASLSSEVNALKTARDRLYQQLQNVRDQMVSLAIDLEGEGLVCDQCWRTYQAAEVRFLPRYVLHPLLDEPQREVSLTRDEASNLLQEPPVLEWLSRERKELDTPELQLGTLFQPQCPEPQHTNPLLPRSHHWVIPIIGGTASGKTLYVATLIHELRRILPAAYGYIVEPRDALSDDNYHELEKQIFIQNSLAPTQPGTKRDMIFSVEPNGPGSNRRLTIYFRDVAGEYWQSELRAGDKTHGHYILSAPCIVMLVDPLADPELREMIGAHLGEQGEKLGDFDQLPPPDQIVRNITLFLKDSGGWMDRKIPKTLLMVLTKADLLDGVLFQEGDPIYDSFEPSRPFPIQRLDALSDSICEKVRGLDRLGYLSQALPGQYANVRWFASSALGYRLKESLSPNISPNAVQLQPNRSPLHVADPILHSMWLAGLLQ